MRTLWVGVAWLATLVVAFLVGERMGGSPGPPPAPPPDARPEAAAPSPPSPAPAVRPAVPEPSLAPAPAPAETVRRDAEEGGRTPADAPDPDAFTLEDVTTGEEAMARIMRHLGAFLARGKEGHHDLLRWLDKNLVDNDALKRLFNSEADAARFVYPMIKFLVQREEEVLDVVETVYETMAENPSFFEELDDDTLEIFTQGAAFVLPGAVDDERLARFRAYAREVLAMPEEELPEAIRKERRHLEQALGLWAPRLAPEEARSRLASGQLRGQEALEVLRHLPPEELAGLDLGFLLAPAVQAADYRTFRALRGLPLSPRDVALLDAAIQEAARQGNLQQWGLSQYLSATQRGGWPAAQNLVEQGLALASPANRPFAEVLQQLNPRPPADYVRWVLDTYGAGLPDPKVKGLENAFGLR